MESIIKVTSVQWRQFAPPSSGVWPSPWPPDAGTAVGGRSGRRWSGRQLLPHRSAPRLKPRCPGHTAPSSGAAPRRNRSPHRPPSSATVTRRPADSAAMSCRTTARWQRRKCSQPWGEAYCVLQKRSRRQPGSPACRHKPIATLSHSLSGLAWHSQPPAGTRRNASPRAAAGRSRGSPGRARSTTPPPRYRAPRLTPQRSEQPPHRGQTQAVRSFKRMMEGRFHASIEPGPRARTIAVRQDKSAGRQPGLTRFVGAARPRAERLRCARSGPPMVAGQLA